MIREAWFCPACQRHHAPHCDTCPAPIVARPWSPIDGIKPWAPTIPNTGDPVPRLPVATCVYRCPDQIPHAVSNTYGAH